MGVSESDYSVSIPTQIYRSQNLLPFELTRCLCVPLPIS